MRKLINFKGLLDQVQAYADEHCEGNFNLAVRVLVGKGMNSDERSSRVRDVLITGAPSKEVISLMGDQFE